MESSILEYKSKITDVKKHFIRSVVAFANSGGGELIIGIDDSGRVVENLDVPESEKISNWISSFISKNSISYISKLYSYKKNKDGTLSIIISGSPTPISDIDGKYYIRVGSTTRETTVDEVEKIMNETISTNTPFDEKDFKKLIKRNDKFNTKKIRNAYGIERQGKTTNLASLIKDNAKLIDANNEMFNIIDSDKIVTKAIKHFRKNPIIIDGQKKNILEIVPNIDTIIRELIINAIAHTRRFPIFIDYGLFHLYTKNTDSSKFIRMIKNRSILHNTDNPIRNKLFRNLGYMESEGQGYGGEIKPTDHYEVLFMWDGSSIHILLVNKYGLINKDIKKLRITDLSNIEPLKRFCSIEGNKVVLKKEVIIHG